MLASISPMTPRATGEPPSGAPFSLCACLSGSVGSIVDPLFIACAALLDCCLGARRRLAGITVFSFAGLESVFVWVITLFQDKSHQWPIIHRKAAPEPLPVSFDSIPSRSVDGNTVSHRGGRGEGVSPQTSWRSDMSGCISSNLQF